MKEIITPEWFKEGIDKKIIHYGDEVDTLYGCDIITITQDELSELLEGGILYFDNDEYATFIRIEK